MLPLPGAVKLITLDNASVCAFFLTLAYLTEAVFALTVKGLAALSAWTDCGSSDPDVYCVCYRDD